MSFRYKTQVAMDHLNNFVSMGLDTPMSQLEMWIAQACDPLVTVTPNLSLNLEICDLINKQGKTCPRDAAFAIVKQVNYSSSSASLALPLLDNCVKNCGYPFHLVISSKEFLNELVRKFPEAPRNISATQRRILELIAEWNIVYAQKSRYREDFKNIHEMYRLLEYKGYQFPHIKDTIVETEPEVVLKTEEQLENEDMKNNGVKLEELLRKGTPAALAEANDMMKLMSGYDTSKKPDYKKEVNAELDRIESKTILLNDLLNQKSPEEFKRRPDPALESLYSSTKVAQSRLQKFIEENEDEDRLARLLEMNDSINTVMQKYDAVKSGKQVEKNSMDRNPGANATTSSEPERGAINLIDFDDFSSLASPSAQKPVTSFDPFGSSPPQQAAFPASTSQQPQRNLLGELSALNFTSQAPFSNNGNVFQQNQMANNSMGMNMVQQKPIVPLQNNSAPKPNVTSSPFDDLFSATPKPSAAAPLVSPTASSKPNTNDLLGDFGFNPTPIPVQQKQPTQFIPIQQQQQSLNQAVPLLNKENIIFNKNGLQIKFNTPSPSNSPQITAQAVFHNITPVVFNDLSFQISVPKSMNVQIEPISSSVLQPFNQFPASQKLFISNPSKEPLRMRFKVNYTMNGAAISEMGEFNAI